MSHEEKLICCFKNDKNLVNFGPNTQKSQTFALSLVPNLRILFSHIMKSFQVKHGQCDSIIFLKTVSLESSK